MMGWQDRDYARGSGGSGRWGGFGGGAGGGTGGGRRFAVTTWLLIINIAVFVLDHLLFSARGGRLPPFFALGAFSQELAIERLQLWRLITFQFLHANLMHLVFNMFALYFFGYIVESYWGRARFIAFYLLSGVGGALLYLILSAQGAFGIQGGVSLVGASAGIFGILIAAARIAPDATVMLLFPPIPMKLRTFAWVLIGIAAFVILTGGRNAGGEVGHLGGAAVGYLLMRFPRLLSWAQGPGGRGPRGPSGPRRPGTDTAEVNRILDKVRAQGLGSLTEAEKRTLHRASEDSGRRGL